MSQFLFALFNNTSFILNSSSFAFSFSVFSMLLILLFVSYKSIKNQLFYCLMMKQNSFLIHLLLDFLVFIYCLLDDVSFFNCIIIFFISLFSSVNFFFDYQIYTLICPSKIEMFWSSIIITWYLLVFNLSLILLICFWLEVSFIDNSYFYCLFYISSFCYFMKRILKWCESIKCFI